MITNQDKLNCAERELALRERVYQRMVMQGKMTPNQARRETELMGAIVEDYRALVALGVEQLGLDIGAPGKED